MQTSLFNIHTYADICYLFNLVWSNPPQNVWPTVQMLKLSTRTGSWKLEAEGVKTSVGVSDSKKWVSTPSLWFQGDTALSVAG